MRIEIDDIKDVKRVAAIMAATECGLIIKEEKPKEILPFFSKKKNFKGYVDVVGLENASEDIQGRFNHLYARYQLEESTKARAKKVSMGMGAVAYFLGLVAISAVITSVKCCESNPEPQAPKQIQKRNLTPAVQNYEQHTR